MGSKLTAAGWLADEPEDRITELEDGTGFTEKRYTVICIYFPGWCTPNGGGPNPAAPWDLITQYDATRNPILGQYDETLQSITDTHLSWMKRFGIDVIAIDWFMQFSGTTLQPLLDHVLRSYLASTVDKPKLCLQFANSTNKSSLTRALWSQVPNYWIRNVFNDPHYYKIDGKPVLVVNSVPDFKTSIGTHVQVKQAWDDARSMCVAAGHPGLIVMGGQADSKAAWTSVTTPAIEGYDGVTGSNIYTTTKDDGVTLGASATNYAELHNAVEFGEGNILEPTVGNGGFDRLRALKDIFER